MSNNLKLNTFKKIPKYYLMKRRSALKNIGLITGGLLLFPSCDVSDEKVSIILNKLKIDAAKEALLKSIVNTILPEGKVPGGLSAKSHNFIWYYIDDCVSEEEQIGFIGGLEEFNQKSNTEIGQKFVDSDDKVRLQTLNDFMANKDESTINDFLSAVKGLSIWNYLNSEYIMTNEMPYKLVPGAGTYKGCKTIDPNEKININA